MLWLLYTDLGKQLNEGQSITYRLPYSIVFHCHVDRQPTLLSTFCVLTLMINQSGYLCSSFLKDLTMIIVNNDLLSGKIIIINNSVLENETFQFYAAFSKKKKMTYTPLYTFS